MQEILSINEMKIGMKYVILFYYNVIEKQRNRNNTNTIKHT